MDAKFFTFLQNEKKGDDAGKNYSMEEEKDPFILQSEKYSQIKALKQGDNGKSLLFKSKNKKRKLVFKFAEIENEEFFKADIKRLKMCIHPALSHFEGYFPPNEDKKCMIATSYIVSNLEELFQKRQKGDRISGFGATQMVTITVGIAFALKFLHSENIIHNDLKPSNVLIDKNYRPLVSDYYFTYNSECSSNFSFDEEISFDKDISAYGSILYELWSGERLEKRIEKGPLNKPKISEKIPPLIAELIQKCWQDDRTNRPSSCEICQFLSLHLLKLAPGIDIPQVRSYLSLLLAFERERLMSIYGDVQCAQNFGKFLLETSSSLSYQIMGAHFANMTDENISIASVGSTNSQSSTNGSPQNNEGKKKKGKHARKKKEQQEKDMDSSESNSSSSMKIKTPKRHKKKQEKAEKIEKPEKFTENPFVAAQNGDLQSIKYHISSLGFDPNQTNKSGQTLMHIAAQTGSVPILQYLVSLPKVKINPTADWGVPFLLFF